MWSGGGFRKGFRNQSPKNVNACLIFWLIFLNLLLNVGLEAWPEVEGSFDTSFSMKVSLHFLFD